MNRQDRIARLKQIATERILVLDGSWGVMFQKEGLGENDFRQGWFADHAHPLKGDNDLLCLTRPDLVTKLHDAYFAAGADISETNTFNATSISQADYGLEGAVRDINLAAARLGREAADRWTAQEPGKPRFLAGGRGAPQPDFVYFAGRERSRRSWGQLRSGLRRLSGAGSGPS